MIDSKQWQLGWIDPTVMQLHCHGQAMVNDTLHITYGWIIASSVGIAYRQPRSTFYRCAVTFCRGQSELLTQNDRVGDIHLMVFR